MQSRDKFYLKNGRLNMDLLADTADDEVPKEVKIEGKEDVQSPIGEEIVEESSIGVTGPYGGNYIALHRREEEHREEESRIEQAYIEESHVVEASDLEEDIYDEEEDEIAYRKEWEKGRNSPLYQSEETFDMLQEMGNMLSEEVEEEIVSEPQLEEVVEVLKEEKQFPVAIHAKKPISREEKTERLKENYLYKMLGKHLTQDILTDEGDVIGQEAEEITKQLIYQCKESGCLLKLMIYHK